MYDNIKINQKLLPYIDNIQSDIFDNADWQTKSLGKGMSTFILTENAIIQVDFQDKEQTIISDFHGFIQFYTDVHGVWYEFIAKYTDGKLVSIKLFEL